MKTVVDLSFPIHAGMPTYPAPWHPVVEITTLARHFIEGRETRRIVIGSHTGTHIDAPLHFLPTGKSVDQLPLDLLVGEASMINLSDKGKISCIEPRDLEPQLRACRTTDRIVLRTDWSDQWMQEGYYSRYPSLTEEACKYLVKAGIRLLAMDTPSPDAPGGAVPSDTDSPNHKYFLKHQVILVEYLTNLRMVQQERFLLVALPLKLIACDGSPARVLAVVD